VTGFLRLYGKERQHGPRVIMGKEQQSSAEDRSIEGLALRYGQALRSYFERRIGDRIEAEDLTQELLTALARRAELDNIDNIEGYLFRVARNLLANRKRTQLVRPSLQFEGGPDPFERLLDEISPEDILIGQESWQLFMVALAELPERARTIFILNRFEEMTGREIAERLGVSLSLIEKEMIRSIRYLREKLQ
jgi:RNA polymerase sigma-70 factor (ECF subfamily)